MLPSGLPGSIAAALLRPDMGLLAREMVFKPDPSLRLCFRVDGPGRIRVTPDWNVGSASFELRHALELALLLRDCPDRPALAALAAARTAVLFLQLEQLGQAPIIMPSWMTHLGGASPPEEAVAAAVARDLSGYQSGAATTLSAEEYVAFVALWPRLGPAEWLMERGGDARLRVDPHTGLNGYGTSHRPRPWAVTFASSTASSVSERGYAGAEMARRRLVRATLLGRSAATEAAAIRADIAAHYALPEGSDVVLAASGTDCELVALALAQLAPHPAPMTALLMAPEETGSGVPLAAVGRHFALGTARGEAVAKGETLEGFCPDTVLAGVALRDDDGQARAAEEVARDCAAVARAAPGRVVLHLLDVSKTGLLGPREADVRAIQRDCPGMVDVVVDACQARLTAERVRGYVAAGWMVLVTGSKFFTGPPFAGAVLVPAGIMTRLRGNRLPSGLRDYSARDEWPDCDATEPLGEGANEGLLLRWRAGLAEMHAFRAIPAAECRATLSHFTEAVRLGVAANTDLALISVPPLNRAGDAAAWDTIGTIVTFTLRDPTSGAWLDVAAARQVYRWLNADLCAALRGSLSADELRLAGLRCHVGQPVKLRQHGATVGALRISAGARLVSGEPSHTNLDAAHRLACEVGDALSVLAKTTLILRHRGRLERVDPPPVFR